MTVVRDADAADLDPVCSLERALFGHDAWSPRSLEQEFHALGNGRLLRVAVAGTRLVGYALLSYTDDTGDLLRVAVNPGHHRQGIASRLCLELLEAAGRQGCTRVLLEVAADNSPALALYAPLGFAEIARRPRYYANGVDAVVMQLPLPASNHRQNTNSSALSEVDVRALEGQSAPARQEGG
jgi:ribosomal-protein-alanine N-acetyltransferase